MTTHTLLKASGLALGAFVLACHSATEPNPRTVPGNCSAEMTTDKAAHPAAPFTESGGTGPDHWVRLTWVGRSVLYEWSDTTGQCVITTRNQ